MTGDTSPPSAYYPPRAPWYRNLREAGYAFLRVTRLDRLRPPGQIGYGAFLLGLLLPGYAFAAHGRTRLGRGLMLACAGGWAIGVIGLGSWWTVPVFGFLVSLHASSLLHLIQPWLKEHRPGSRILMSLLAVMALIFVGYLPLQRSVEAHALVPLNVEGRPIVVGRGGNPAEVKRGDWVAYRLEDWGESSVIIHGGYALAPVLAVAGDTVEFGPHAVRVNGVSQAREEMMPVEGMLTVPADFWFIWPRMQTVVYRGVAESDVQDALCQRAIVQRGQFVGRPFERWFFRNQRLP